MHTMDSHGTCQGHVQKCYYDYNSLHLLNSYYCVLDTIQMHYIDYLIYISQQPFEVGSFIFVL